MSTHLLLRHNRSGRRPPSKEVDAIRRLRKALKIVNWGPDLVIKAFQDLDTVFFRGVLVGNCLVKWRDPEGCRRRYANSCAWYGLTERIGSPADRQVMITLSAEHIFLKCENPYDEMWKTMIVS